MEPSTAVRQAEVAAAKTMIERTNDRFELHPERLAADTAYGSAEMVAGWSMSRRSSRTSWQRQVERTDGTFSRGDFTYDQTTDAYICPGGKTCECRRPFAATDRRDEDNTILYRARKSDCDACPVETSVLPQRPGPRRRAPSMKPPATRPVRSPRPRPTSSLAASGRRSVLFAHLKRILRLDRLRLRGPCGARDEFLLAATAQNLRKLAKLIRAPAPIVAT